MGGDSGLAPHSFREPGGGRVAGAWKKWQVCVLGGEGMAFPLAPTPERRRYPDTGRVASGGDPCICQTRLLPWAPSPSVPILPLLPHPRPAILACLDAFVTPRPPRAGAGGDRVVDREGVDRRHSCVPFSLLPGLPPSQSMWLQGPKCSGHPPLLSQAPE